MAFNYPYGDTQQLNLDWIITKIKEMEESGLGLDLEEISKALIALKYNTATTYAVYDYAFYNGKLYRCISGTSGTFNPAAWQEALIGDDVSILTSMINAVEAAAVMDVKFVTSGTNGKIQQKYNDTYHDVVEVDYTPVQNSKRPLSSNAGYELTSAISNEATARANTDAAIERGLAIVANGNTHYAAEKDKYIYVKNHSTLAEGLYKALSTIPTNDPITLSNVTPASDLNGALNDLQNLAATSYCKMPDGTALAWGNVGQITFSNESIKEGTVPLPFPFISGNAHATPFNTSNVSYMLWAGASLQDANTMAWTLATVNGSPITVTNRGFAWFAIGRWK